MTAPVISPVVTGTKGANGFYASDVKVAWKTEDKESGVSQRKGCDDVTVAADTDGTTFTCTAVSTGGKASRSVTIKRDTTAPVLSVPDTILQENAPASGVTVDYTARRGRRAGQEPGRRLHARVRARRSCPGATARARCGAPALFASPSTARP